MKKLACKVCGKWMCNDEIAFCLRQFGYGSFLCLPCVARQFDTDAEELWAVVERLKESGCEYFTRTYV